MTIGKAKKRKISFVLCNNSIKNHEKLFKMPNFRVCGICFCVCGSVWICVCVCIRLAMEELLLETSDKKTQTARQTAKESKENCKIAPTARATATTTIIPTDSSRGNMPRPQTLEFFGWNKCVRDTLVAQI